MTFIIGCSLKGRRHETLFQITRNEQIFGYLLVLTRPSSFSTRTDVFAKTNHDMIRRFQNFGVPNWAYKEVQSNPFRFGSTSVKDYVDADNCKM